MPMISWAPRSYPCFPFSAFESSRNLCTVEDEHETQQVKATIHTSYHDEPSSRFNSPTKTRTRFHDAETWRSSRQPTRTRSLRRPGPHCNSFNADTGHRSATIPVIVVVVDVVVVVGTVVVVAFNNGCNGCLDAVFATLDSLCTFVSSSVVWRSQIYSITLWITSSFDNFRFLGMSGTRDLNFVK